MPAHLRPCDPGYERAAKKHCLGCQHWKTYNGNNGLCDYLYDTGESRGGSVFDCDRNDGRKKRSRNKTSKGCSI